MTYLEDILKTLAPKTNVLVQYSSSTTFELCDGGTISMRDCLGNHWVENWQDAFNYAPAVGHFPVTRATFDLTASDSYSATVTITIDLARGDKLARQYEIYANNVGLKDVMPDTWMYN